MTTPTNAGTATPAPCSCGDATLHEIARRHTADGNAVVLWSDSAITGRLGYRIPGVPIARPRTVEAMSAALTIGWLFLGECELFDVAELPALHAVCRWTAERGGLPGDVRARVAAESRFRVRPVWTVTSTDRDGAPTERVWKLPRLRWPGLAVWDTCGGEGRYQVWNIDRHDVCTPTGVRFSTLDELSAYLDSVGVKAA